MQNAYPSILAQMAAMVEKHKQKHEKPNFMKATGITTYPTHIVDVETETTTFSVTLAENDFGWERIVTDVDNNDDIDASDLISRIYTGLRACQIPTKCALLTCYSVNCS